MRLPAGEENVTPLRLYAEPLPPKIANVKRSVSQHVHAKFMLSVLIFRSTSCNKSETLVDYL